MSLITYLEACSERYAFDREYRRRLQRELFDTDTHRSIQATLTAHRAEETLKTITRRKAS